VEPTKKQIISVRLDDATKQRVELAARLLNQSADAFLAQAGKDRARQVLLAWSIDQYKNGEGTFSELAAMTGLAIEEIMLGMSQKE